MKPVWEELLGLSEASEGCSQVIEWMLKQRSDRNNSRALSEIRWHLTLITYWLIWKAMCEFVFQGKAPDHAVVTAKVRKAYNEISMLQVNRFSQHRRDQQMMCSTEPLVETEPTWRRLVLSTIKINCDATWSSITGRGGVGVLARNHEGEVVGGYQ